MSPPDLTRAAESNVALILARLVTPILMAATLGVGGWIGNAVYNELKALRADIRDVLIEQGKQEMQINEHERRLNRLDIRSQRQGYELPR